MNVVSQGNFSKRQKEQRSQFRIRVALPALASAGEIKISVSIVDIAMQGAMIETGTILQEGARLAVSGGTVNVIAVVVWRGRSRQYGLRFERPLAQREVKEQMVRSSAVSLLRCRLLTKLPPSIENSGQR